MPDCSNNFIIMPLLSRHVLVSGNAPVEYPADAYYVALWQNDEDAIEISLLHPFSGEWGKPLSTQLTEQVEEAVPQRIDGRRRRYVFPYGLGLSARGRQKQRPV